MIITRILFREAPAEDEQAEIHTLFGDKYGPESTDTRYVYISSASKGESIKALLASDIGKKVIDIIVSGSTMEVNSSTTNISTIEESKESTTGE